MDINSPYIFVIGFNKSGTTSIHKLFADNGFPSIHWDGGNLAKNALLNILSGKRVFNGYDHLYKVYSDIFYRNNKFWFEGNSLFREIDLDYPNSFFIYNKRSMDDWINSRINHNGRLADSTLLDSQLKVLGVKDVNSAIEHWKKIRVRFEQDIQEYFQDNERFIELDITDLDFVDKLSHKINFPLDSKHWKKHNANLEIAR